MSPLTLLALLDTGLPGSPLQMPLSIAYKELFVIVLAASLWGHQWSAKRVKFCSDNTAVVEVLWSSTSRDSNLKVLLRHFSLLAARHSFAFTAWTFLENQMPQLTPFLILNFSASIS